MTTPSHLTDIEALNLLQDAGIISDNCVNLGDVSREDWERAEEYLKLFTKPHPPSNPQ